VKTRLLEESLCYTGEQLRSGWVQQTAGLEGDAAVGFIGPCDVAREYMVDRVDLDAGAEIRSPSMVHVIIEHPGLDLGHITARQRLLMALAGEVINRHLGEALIMREGDDLYLRDRKLSVSVATTSPKSGLIHAGFNVRGAGAPVAAVGIEELGLEPRAFADRLLAAYAAEVESARRASGKVKEVR